MKTMSFSEYDSSKHDVLRQLHDNYFYYSNDDLWADAARKRLPVLMDATDMLMCGEDLGFVPSCVPAVMHELGVIGLRIQRMPGPEAPGEAHLSVIEHVTNKLLPAPVTNAGKVLHLPVPACPFQLAGRSC
jgi:hypothetical protein